MESYVSHFKHDLSVVLKSLVEAYNLVFIEQFSQFYDVDKAI